ncbi:hypothetical protein QN277_001511 [Acacia crassicarpa]|uniref:AB hydrolase-1 domain-containing protein n=1 Tax=Acacia crassicarpa TaxID=499986 RepID=A0AAE1TH52_9FABA|nr:hypothetical protein QN277_001511 [Acacia crassicarpa]
MRISIIVMFRALLRMVMKMVGMRPQKVEIDQQGTVINFWVPSKPQNKKLAVVFLHGFAADGILTWQFQVMALARKYAVYVPDLVFFGESTTERPERSPEFQAECVAEGLKKLGVVEKWRVVGFSYGGIVGFKMAEMYSDMVVSVVVSGSTTELMESFSRPTLQKLGGFSSWSQLLLPRTADGVRVLLDVGIYKRIPYPIFFLREFLEEFICVNRRKKDELLAAVVKNIDSAIPKYPQKIHLIWGAKDKIFDLEDAKNLKTELGEKAELHVIENAGHLVMLERPFVFNSLLSHILPSLPASSVYRHRRSQPAGSLSFRPRD